MTRVRAIDADHDWTFGKGQNNYLRNNNAVVQDINTRLYCFLGDCFFDTGAGIDWWNQLGAKNQIALNLAISAVILNTLDVIAIAQLSSNLDTRSRVFSVRYQVQTSYSVSATGIFSMSTNTIG